MSFCLKSLLPKFIEEPYRIFFPIGILMGLLGVGHWMFHHLGWTSNYLSFQHASIQIQLFMYCFVAGFLLTAMPKILMSSACTPIEFSYFFILILLSILFEFFLIWVGVQVCFILGIIGLHVFILNRRDSRSAPLPPPFVLIFFGFINAVLGATILLFYQLSWIPSWGMSLGRQMFQLGFLLSIVMGIGGFMAPRFMGYFSSSVIQLDKDPAQKAALQRKEVQFHVLVGLVLFFSFWMDAFGYGRFGSLIRALFVSAQILYTTQIYRPLPTKNIFNLLLSISFWNLLIGLWGVFIFPEYHMAFKHFIFIGSLSLMTLVVSTKVICSHAGLESYFHEKMISLYILGIAVLTALGFRFCADFDPDKYMSFIFYSSTIWVLGVLIWFLTILPKLFIFSKREGGCPKKRG